MSNPTILHVEDEWLIRSLLADQLTPRGFEIIEAANADKALSLLNAGLSFDLLLTDIRMPGTLDGFELAQLVRAKVPVSKGDFMFSAHSTASVE